MYEPKRLCGLFLISLSILFSSAWTESTATGQGAQSLVDKTELGDPNPVGNTPGDEGEKGEHKGQPGASGKKPPNVPQREEPSPKGPSTEPAVQGHSRDDAPPDREEPRWWVWPLIFVQFVVVMVLAILLLSLRRHADEVVTGSAVLRGGKHALKDVQFELAGIASQMKLMRRDIQDLVVALSRSPATAADNQRAREPEWSQQREAPTSSKLESGAHVRRESPAGPVGGEVVKQPPRPSLFADEKPRQSPSDDQTLLNEYHHMLKGSPEERDSFRRHWKPEPVCLENMGERLRESAIPPQLARLEASGEHGDEHFWVIPSGYRDEGRMFPAPQLLEQRMALRGASGNKIFRGIFDLADARNLSVERPAWVRFSGDRVSVIDAGRLNMPD